MNNIPCFDELINNLNNFFVNNSNFFTLESKIEDLGDNFIKNLYEQLLEYLDSSFKNSRERKEKYYVKDKIVNRTLITSLGSISINITRYQSKETHKSYVYIYDLLALKPYQRLTLYAMYQIVKKSMELNMAQAGQHSLRNEVISRSTVSKIIKKLDGRLKELEKDVKRSVNTIYIEVDEIHANLQNPKKNAKEKSKNSICPVVVVHEGHIDPNKKRKQLKNPHYFALPNCRYKDCYELAYDYIKRNYRIDNIKYTFISGDGGNGILDYDTCFGNAIFVADKFHISKKLLYIFKDKSLVSIARSYLNNNKLDMFNKLAELQYEKYPEQKSKMKKFVKFITKNINHIINQNHLEYKCCCSMEGTISMKYARYITSSPFAFSEQGLANKLNLLTLKANKHNLTFEDFLILLYGKDYQKEYIDKIKNMMNKKVKVSFKGNSKYEIKTAPIPKLDTNGGQEFINELIKGYSII